MPQNSIASNFAPYSVCHHTKALSHKAPSRKHNVSERVITKKAVVPTRVTLLLRCHTTFHRANIVKNNSRTATSEFCHGLFIKTEHAFQQTTLPYTTTTRSRAITTSLNNSLSRLNLNFESMTPIFCDSAMTIWVKLPWCIGMLCDKKKQVNCAKLFLLLKAMLAQRRIIGRKKVPSYNSLL